MTAPPQDPRATRCRRATAARPPRPRRSTTSRSCTPGSLDLVVGDLDGALAKGRTAVLATGGYIGASDERRDGDHDAAVITYRIPASRWEDALGSLRGLATKVVAEQTQATEVGGQIVDLEARLRNLRASEQVLVGIAEGTGQGQRPARGADPHLRRPRPDRAARRAACGARGPGRVRHARDDLGTEVAQVEEAKAGWDPATDVDGATATLIGALQAITSGAIWFGIVWLPAILLLVLILLVARWVYRRVAPSLPSPGPGGPMAGWGGGAAEPSPGRSPAGQEPAGASHRSSASRARARVRFHDGQSWIGRVVLELVRAAGQDRGQRGPVRGGQQRPRVDDRLHGLVAELRQVPRVEPRPAAGRDERRVDRPVQVPLGHERLRPDDVDQRDGHQRRDPQRMQDPPGALRDEQHGRDRERDAKPQDRP